MMNIEVDMKGRPVEGAYMEWERNIFDIMVNKLEISSSDGFGMMMSKNKELLTAYNECLTAEDAFDKIFK